MEFVCGLTVAFLAICIWLSVRVLNRRERWAKWTLATVVFSPVLYFLSFGPACWYYIRSNPDSPMESKVWFDKIYWPIGWLTAYGDDDPFFIYSIRNWYALLGAPKNSAGIFLPFESSGRLGGIIDRESEDEDVPVNHPASTPDAPSESN